MGVVKKYRGVVKDYGSIIYYIINNQYIIVIISFTFFDKQGLYFYFL